MNFVRLSVILINGQSDYQGIILQLPPFKLELQLTNLHTWSIFQVKTM